jgi:N-acyl homoserine lactone hydrolase
MATRVHAIQTGSVRIKTAQVQGQGRGVARQFAIFTDRQWTEWLPTYAFVIEHVEDIFVVDTGQGLHLLRHHQSKHPYLRWEVNFRLDQEEQIGPRLRQMGILPRDVRQVLLTHLHVDHDGGLNQLAGVEALATAHEINAAPGWAGQLRGYLPQRWPQSFDPRPIPFEPERFGLFETSYRVTRGGDVFVVPTPGHTPGHASVLVEMGDADNTLVMLAGDASYTEQLMIDGLADGVSPVESVTITTLKKIRDLAASRRLVYLPTHDPGSATRLETLQPVFGERTPREKRISAVGK